jgi:hypothetical protein
VIKRITTAIKPAIRPRYIKPRDSSPPPKNKTIGNANAEMENVPKAAASILAVVNFVLSSLSSVILAVSEEYGTLTIVKQVL